MKSIVMVIAFAFGFLFAGCGGSDPPADSEQDLIACESPEHEGLLCWTQKRGDIGRCVDGQCATLGCSVDADCEPEACRVPTCTKASPQDVTGVCTSTFEPDGNACSMPGYPPGVCDTGKCVTGSP